MRHSQEIRTIVEKEIATKSLSQYFEIDEEFSALCKRCNDKKDIFYGTDALKHICIETNQRLRSRQQPKDNDVNRMTQSSTQHSIATENANTSSHHDDINMQAPRNQDQQSNTSLYCADAMAALEESDNWMWKHVVKLNSFALRCNTDCCLQTYYNKNTSRLITSMKAHLYHKHKIWNEQDHLEWGNNNDLIWQYFNKIDLYKGKYALIHHICLKKNQRLKSRQKSKDKNVNIMTQQSIVTENANTNSHHDDINRQAPRNQDLQQSDISLYYTDIMAALQGSNYWVRKHVLKLDNFAVQCNINGCNEIFITNSKHASRMITTIKGHLYHKHEIWNKEDRLKWINDDDLIWRYFDKVDLYKEKCKFCNILLYEAHIPFIKNHLQRHCQEIRTIVRKEIADKSLTQYFEIDEKEFSALCRLCNVKKDIFYGTDTLIHICLEKNQRLRSRQEPESNNVNRMTQQSLATENANTNFHYDINRQALRNQDQQSNTSRCCADFMAALEGSDEWVREHLKLDNSYVRCRSCTQAYKIGKRNHFIEMIRLIKAHLYHKHEIWNEEDRLKWENDNDLKWRYFDKVGLYEVKCKFCDYLLCPPYVQLITSHLQRHRREIRAGVRREIADKSVSHYFEIDEEKFSARCKICNVEKDIFYGADALIHHICFKNNQYLRRRKELAAARQRSDNWVWKHDLKLNNSTIRCNIDKCNKTYHNKSNKSSLLIQSMKVHLYHKHEIWTEKDRLKWEKNNDLVWRYYDKVDLYKGKCKFCMAFHREADLAYLRWHLRQKHSQEIRAVIKKEIAYKSLSQYFEIQEEEFSARCKHCNVEMNIFYGSDVLVRHNCFNYQPLRSRQEPEHNNVNTVIQQSLADQNTNTSSHHDNINRQAPENRENQQSNTSRNCADATAALDESDKWVWKHVVKLNSFTIQCNIDCCDQTYCNKNTGRLIKLMKVHLYHKHKIWTEEDRLKWESNNDFIWQYFDKVELYKGKCKFCKKIRREAYLPNLKGHLRKKHSQEISVAAQKEIATKLLSHCFKIDEKKLSAWCKRCYFEKDILYGTDALIHHICFKKNQRLRSRQISEDKNVNIMTQQSIVTDNASTNSHHDDINRHAPQNQVLQQSNTSRYRAELIAALEGADDFVWEHLKLDNSPVRNDNRIDADSMPISLLFLTGSNVRCRYCIQTYEIGKRNKFIKFIEMLTMIKAHLYHKHEIWDEEDRLKWETDNDLIWRYFDKVDLYEAKCKFCGSLLHQPYVSLIKSHLQSHREEIRADVRKKIADKSLSQYFEIYYDEFYARCKRCNVEKDIFNGTDALARHICSKKYQRLRSQQKSEDNNVNRMTQQSTGTENANTSSHHDDINRQTPRNQDHQSNYAIRLLYSNTGINDLRSHYQHHMNENSRCERGAAYNSDYRIMQQDVAAENMTTRYHHESIYWHDLESLNRLR
ncbi:PREDICTED: uncharacterized protein LOC108766635 [Trachymyrmex cornetzi]|uniref:uncharacterized protein LOC108766635 n=1 Tax=Trachymyrmex cornetzi TaxID=471704 RepID=UPI00084F3A50|nr:PREDICTED: uncharacterized protein LOC108766635 [Trachymyrmex cornetzi]